MNTNSPLYSLFAGKAKSIARVGGRVAPVSLNFTRPANATPYSALDAVGPTAAVLELPGCGRVSGADGYIVGAYLATSKSDITPQVRLHLFSAAPTPVADNSQFPRLWADEPVKLGTLNLTALSTEGAGSDSSSASNFVDRTPFKCAFDSTSLFCVLETLDAFTPASLQAFTLRLFLDQN